MFGGYAVKAEKLSLFNICYCQTVCTKAILITVFSHSVVPVNVCFWG
jgi:hypothetical protein